MKKTLKLCMLHTKQRGIFAFILEGGREVEDARYTAAEA